MLHNDVSVYVTNYPRIIINTSNTFSRLKSREKPTQRGFVESNKILLKVLVFR